MTLLPKQISHLCFRLQNFHAGNGITFDTDTSRITISRACVFEPDGQPGVIYSGLTVDVDILWPMEQASESRLATAEQLSKTTVRFTVPRSEGDLTIDVEYSSKPEPIQLQAGATPGPVDCSKVHWVERSWYIAFPEAGTLAD